MAMNPISRDYASTSTGSQTPIGVDWRDTPSGFSYQVVFNAGASGSITIDTTLDNLNAIPAPTPVWVASSAITSTTSGFIGSPVQFIRLTVGSLSGGTITLKVLEGAPDGGGDSSGVGGGAAQNVAVVGGSVGLLGGTAIVGRVGINQTTQGVTNGVAFSQTGHWQNHQSLTDGSSHVIQAAGAGAVQNYLSSMQISTLATTVAVTLTILDGVTAIFVLDLPAGASSQNISFSPSFLQGSAATALNVQLSGAPTGAVAFNAQGFSV